VLYKLNLDITAAMPDFPSLLTWANAGVLLNSAFTTSLVGALAGAFAGARAAQHVAERARETEQLQIQIRTANAAITASFTIANLLLAFKKQHIKPLFDGFVEKKAELEEFKRKRNAGEIPKDLPFEFTADLRTLQMPLLPIDLLQRLVFEKLSVVGRPLALGAALAGVAASLTELMQKRAVLIEVFRNLPESGRGTFPALYFGLPFAEGRTSTEYADLLQGLHSHTDDGIFFSELLCQDLVELGETALSRYKERVPDTKERVSEVSFEDARVAGLMPDSELYKDWTRGFQRRGDA
jgi:hypothetical protein